MTLNQPGGGGSPFLIARSVSIEVARIGEKTLALLRISRNALASGFCDGAFKKEGYRITRSHARVI
jgi:hypothetical protein